MDIVSLVSTVTLLIAPYTWTYDQLLLIIPISLMSLAIDGKGWRFLLALCLFLVMDLIVLLLLVPDTLLGVEILNAFIPLIVFALLLWKIFSHPKKGFHPG